MIKFNKRLLVVWLVLAIAHADLPLDRPLVSGALRASAVVTSGVIVIAVIKVRIIFREFMEVRQAPALLCRLTDAWVVLIAVSLLGSYFAGVAIR